MSHDDISVTRNLSKFKLQWKGSIVTQGHQIKRFALFQQRDHLPMTKAVLQDVYVSIVPQYGAAS